MITFDELVQRITAWAETNLAVRAALILGSRARIDHPADEWSDLDVLVFAENLEQFFQSSDWVKTIAPTWLTFLGRAGDGNTLERRTLFVGDLDVDIAFYPADRLVIMQENIPVEIADIIRRGVKLLVDKDGLLNRVLNSPLPEKRLFTKPSQQEFTNAVSDFWYHTLWSARHLRRGELWWAKSCVDGYLKGLIQQMLEWHARALKGNQFDTWLRGRFLEEWADPRAIKKLEAVFASYEVEDVARALDKTMELYRWLEDETAAQWGYTFPRDGEQHAADAAYTLLEKYGIKNPTSQ